jgi:cytochrome c
MPWCTERVQRAAAIGAVALAALACGPSTSSPPPSAAKSGGPLPEPTAVAEGQALIAEKGCGGCHAIPGIPGASGTIGPNLAGIANRSPMAGGAVPNNGADDLKRWILDPPAVKPGTAMPKLGLTDDEASRIVAYLETLR